MVARYTPGTVLYGPCDAVDACPDCGAREESSGAMEPPVAPVAQAVFFCRTDGCGAVWVRPVTIPGGAAAGNRGIARGNDRSQPVNAI